MKSKLHSGARWGTVLALLLCTAGNLAALKPLQPGPQDAEIARRFVHLFSREHLTRTPFGEEVAARAWTNYLATLDFERVFFTFDDIRRFEPRKNTLCNDISGGDLSFGYDTFQVFVERISNRYDYVCTLLDKGFDTRIDESYTWKRKNAPWARDDAEWNELWRKRVKNEYVRILVDREMRKAEAEKKKDPAPAAATNQTGVAEAIPDPDAGLSPEESIRKKYKQMVTVMHDCDAEWVLQRYVSAVTMAYDPHSVYMSPSSREDFDIEMKLSLCGIGAILRPEDGAAKIERTIPGGPADRDKREKRLRPGDKIIAVGQDREPLVDILHWSLDKTVRLIRGPKGSRVVLKVIPASDPTGTTAKIVDLVRDEVKLEEQAAKAKMHSVKGEEGKDRALAVIKLPAFYANMQASQGDADYRSSTDDIRKLLEEMKAKGAEGVLLDLRGNGGGSLVEAIRMTGLFVRAGPVVQVRERSTIRVMPDTDHSVVFGGPLVVLVNRLSASASEILAGALQDYGRAVIVGDSRTHGKGTVQTVLDLGRDRPLGSVRITTASFYRISGGSTQLRGIASDLVLHSPLDYMDIGEDALPCPIPWSQVPPAYYRPVGNLASIIAELKKKSDTRLEADARFTAYTRLLERIDKMNRTSEITLQLDQRRKLAATEKEIIDLQDSMLPEGASESEKEEKNDLVLGEGLAILADLVSLSRHPAAGMESLAENDSQRSLTVDFMEWLRNTLQ